MVIRNTEIIVGGIVGDKMEQDSGVTVIDIVDIGINSKINPFPLGHKGIHCLGIPSLSKHKQNLAQRGFATAIGTGKQIDLSKLKHWSLPQTLKTLYLYSLNHLSHF